MIIEHHEQFIQGTKNKIRHKTAQTQLKYDATTTERIIHKTDLVHIKHTDSTLRILWLESPIAAYQRNKYLRDNRYI